MARDAEFLVKPNPPRVGVRPGLWLTVFSLAILLCAAPRLTLGHSPHHDTTAVIVLQDSGGDEVVLALVRSSLFRSSDGGSSWQRVIRGLDHKFPLMGLASSRRGEGIYVSSVGDGIYRSLDGGRSFEKVNGNLESLRVDIVNVAPWDPMFVLAGHAGEGMFMSRAGGYAWTPAEEDFGKVTTIGFGLSESDPILVGDHMGALFISENHGQTWQKMFTLSEEEAITAVAISRDAGHSLAILVGTAHGRVLFSNDGGTTFLQTTSSGESKPIRSVAFSPDFANDGRAFATGWDAGVMCSQNSMSTWTKCNAGLTRDHQSKIMGRPSFNTITPSPNFQHNQKLYVGGFDGFFVTTDAGRRWRHIETYSPYNIVSVALSPSYKDDATVIFTNYMWGAFVSGNAGESWQSINRGARDYRRRNGLTCLFSVVFSPDYRNDETIFTSTWWRILKSQDRGGSWRQITPLEGEEWSATHHGSTIALSPDFSNDGMVLVGTHTQLLLRSDDRGESFRILARKGALIGSVAISPDFKSDATILVGDTAGIHKSSDGGATWSYVQLIDPARYASLFASPAHPPEELPNWNTEERFDMDKTLAIRVTIPPGFKDHGTAFAATAEGLYRTNDKGITWNPAPDPLASSDMYIEAVAASPAYDRDRTVIASVRGHGHLVSFDGADSFERLSDELDRSGHQFGHYPGVTPPFPAIVFSPNYSEDHTILGFSGPTLLKSNDQGRSWIELDIPKAGWLDRFSVWSYNQSRAIISKVRRNAGILAAGIAGLGIVLLAAIILFRRARSRDSVQPLSS